MTGALRLTVVVPAFNEGPRLPSAARRLLHYFDRAGIAAEVIVVDDGSTDGTRAALASVADDRLVVVERPVNGGKGAALGEGVRRARGASIVCFDADLPYPLGAIATALDYLDRGAQLVAGARDLHPDGRREQPWARRLCARALQRLTRDIVVGVPDTQCGFKAFDADTARALFAALTIDGFAFDVELLALAQAWHLRIVRMPLAMTAQAGSSVVLVRDGTRMVRDILRIRAAMRARAARDLAPRPE